MRRRFIIEGYEDYEIANIISALSSIGKLPQVFTTPQHSSEKNPDHVGVNIRGEIKAIVYGSPGIQVDEMAQKLETKFPQIEMKEWRKALQSITNPNYTSYAIRREKTHKKTPGWDRLWPKNST